MLIFVTRKDEFLKKLSLVADIPCVSKESNEKKLKGTCYNNGNVSITSKIVKHYGKVDRQRNVFTINN